MLVNEVSLTVLRSCQKSPNHRQQWIALDSEEKIMNFNGPYTEKSDDLL